MSVSTAVRMALAKGNKKQIELAEFLGIQRQAVNLKLAKERWPGAELARIAAFTGGKLACIYPDGQQILIELSDDPENPAEKPAEKAKAKPKETKAPVKAQKKKAPAKQKQAKEQGVKEEQISFFEEV